MVSHDVAVRDGGGHSRIGLAFLRQFRVTFDIPNDRIYLAKGTEFDKRSKQRAVGIGFLRKNEKTVVTWIEPDSPAADAGISVNDELVTIVGEPIAGRPLAEIQWMLGEKVDPSGKLKLVFYRANKERKVELTIRAPSGTRLIETANRPDREEAAAIDEIQKLGGKVTIDEDAPGKPVRAVDFSDTQISDDALRSLKYLKGLEALILAHTKVTDAGMEHITALVNLRMLDVGDTKVSDDGMKVIGGLPELRTLCVDNTQITDDGLKYLNALVNLTILYVGDTQVSDDGMKLIGGLPELLILRVDNTQITDEGLKYLKGMKHLERLYTMGTKVTRAGRKELERALPNLRDSDDGREP